MRLQTLRLTVIVIGAFCLFSSILVSKTKTENSKKHYLKYQYSISSDRPDYYLSSINAVFHNKGRDNKISIDTVLPIRWGIVSHHLLIKDLIAEYFSRLSKIAHPTTIILVGPDHFSRSEFPITVSRLPWKTPFGLVQADNKIVQELIAAKIANNDENAFYNEHSMAALVPFIKYYFPHTRVVTVIIRSDASIKDGHALAKYISSLRSPDVLPIASLDFSHYKTSIVAQHEDSITLNILSHFNSIRYNEAFVDSHIAFYTVLESCNILHSNNLNIIQHTNSGLVSGILTDPCTSYFNLWIW